MSRLLALAAAGLLLQLAAAAPARAFDCPTGDKAACNCVGAIYKVRAESPPGDLRNRTFRWNRAGARLARHFADGWDLVVLLLFYNDFDVISGPTKYDNLNAGAPWDAIGLGREAPEDGERVRMRVHLYAPSPAAGQVETFETGDSDNGAALVSVEAMPNGLEELALSGTDGVVVPLSTNSTLINRAINNRFDTLRSAILADGC